MALQGLNGNALLDGPTTSLSAVILSGRVAGGK